MKKVTLITVIILFASLNGLLAQHYQTNPIPCYGYQLTGATTAFQELNTFAPPTREKREMEVIISSVPTFPFLVFAKVWVVKEGGTVVLGPFTVYLDTQLSVPIDNSQWGVVIKCDWTVNASVWVE